MARAGLLIVRALLLAAVAASAMLVTDLQSTEPAFCAQQGGCATVQASEYAAPFGVPLPFVGLVGFGALYLLSLVRDARAMRLLRVALLGAGLAALVLIVLQARVIEAFCSLCLIVDGAAILTALVALQKRAFAIEGPRRLSLSSLVSLLVVAVAAPLSYRALIPDDATPAALEALYAREGVQVVEVADFTCPHCRQLAPALDAALEGSNQPIHRVMIHVTAHPRAVEAAGAHVCAEAAGKGEALTALLFTTGAIDRSARDWAARISMEPEAFVACIADPATHATLEARTLLAKELGVRGVPTTFIGTRIFNGAVPAETLREAVDALDADGGQTSLPRVAFFLGLIAVIAAILALGATRARETQPSSEGS